MILEIAKEKGLKVFVETGTGEGKTFKEMVISEWFDQLHTIDINIDCGMKMARRFADIPKAHCWRGSSTKQLSRILANIHEPTLFWLDARMPPITVRKTHVASPLLDDLEIIKAHGEKEGLDHVVLINDAEYYKKLKRFKYPQLKDIEGWSVEVQDNVIKCTKQSETKESNV